MKKAQTKEINISPKTRGIIIKAVAAVVIVLGIFYSTSNHISSCNAVKEDVLTIVNDIPLLKMYEVKVSLISKIKETNYDSEIKTRYCKAVAIAKDDEGLREELPISFQIYAEGDEEMVQVNIDD